MRVPPPGPLAAERDATAAKPQPLPRPEGDRRVQAALDADRAFGRYLSACFVIAATAGSGFGRLAGAQPWAWTTLWCLTAAGLAARCIGPRAAWRRGVADVHAYRVGAARLAALALGIEVLASIRGGAEALMVGGPVLAVAAVILAAAYIGRAANTVVPLLLIAAGGAIPWFVDSSVAPIWLASVGLGAGALVAAVSSRGADGVINAAMAVTRFTGITYAFLVWRWPVEAPACGAIVAGAAIITLDVLAVRRRSFVAIAAAVAAVHLGALPPTAELLGRGLPLQIVATILEFILLCFAGFRYVQAALWGLPGATYRLAPLCIVPRLNRAWDHPVKINVA